MKIGIVSGEFPPMRGGVGDFTRELSNALAHNHHEVYLLLPDGSEWDHDLPNVSVSSQIKKWGWKTATTMTRWAESEHLDVINLQYQTAAYNMHLAINLLPGRLGSAPLVVTFHDLNPPYLFPKAGWLRNAVVTRLARRASGVIVTNQEDEKKLCDLKVSLARIPIGSNIPCAPPEDFDAIKFRAGIGVEPQDLLLAYFGFLNQSKGGDVLVKTLNTLRDHGVPAKLLLIGGRTGSSDPTNRAFADHIDTMISRMGLSEMVLMTGYVPAEQVSAALISADICVLPFRDGISLRRGSLMAAFAHGRPVVSTLPQVHIEEIVNGNNALLVPPNDAQALAQAILGIHDDKDRLTTLANGSASLAERFSWDSIARQTTEYFSSILTQG